MHFLSLQPGLSAKTPALFQLGLSAAVFILFISAAPRECRANGGPSPGVFAVIAETPVVLGEAGVNLEIPTSPRHSVQLWAGGGGCLVFFLNDLAHLTPVAPDISLEARTYFRKDAYRGGFFSFHIPGGYLFQHDLVVLSPGLKIGYKAYVSRHFTMEVYATTNLSFYHEVGSKEFLEYRFFPFHTTGLRFTFETYTPRSPCPASSPQAREDTPGG